MSELRVRMPKHQIKVVKKYDPEPALMTEYSYAWECSCGSKGRHWSLFESHAKAAGRKHAERYERMGR